VVVTVGQRTYAPAQQVFLPRAPTGGIQAAEATPREIDVAVRDIIAHGFDRAVDILKSRRADLESRAEIRKPASRSARVAGRPPRTWRGGWQESHRLKSFPASAASPRRESHTMSARRMPSADSAVNLFATSSVQLDQDQGAVGCCPI
jgi:hypothetical protein